MAQENSTSNPEGSLSQSELELKDIHLRIGSVQRYLMDTFFQDDTWATRQAYTYATPLLVPKERSVTYDWYEHDWESEKSLLVLLLDVLGDRMCYYEAAYKFPDILSALKMGTGQDFVEMMAEHSGDSKDQLASQIVAETKNRIFLLTLEFEEFLESDTFKQAFTVQVDPETAEFTVTDLELDAKEFRRHWSELESSKG